MIEKNTEEVHFSEKFSVSTYTKQPAGVRQTRAIVFCTIAFVLSILLTVAPLSRIPDPVIQLQTPLGTLLAQVGMWLPGDLGLAADPQASKASTNYIEFLALIALAFIIYGLCALLIHRQQAPEKESPRRFNQISRLIWLGTIVAGGIYVFTPAMLSHDIFVYASYSRLLAVHHANPYFVPLSAYPYDPYNSLNYWTKAIAAYGPAWLGICSLWGFLLGPQPLGYVLAFRLFALAAHLLNTWLVAATLRASGQSPRVVTLGTLLYAWNPLVLLESSLGGHNDVFMVTFLLLGIFFSIQAEKKGQLTRPRGYLPPVIAFTLAALVKFTTLPLIALFIILLAWRALRPALSNAVSFREIVSRHWRPALQTICIASLTSVLAALALYGPFWIGHSIQSIRSSFTSPPSALYSENSILRALVIWSQQNRLPPHSLENTLIQIFSDHNIWNYINIITIAVVMLIGAIYLWRLPGIHTFVLASLATLGALLIVTPWFFSWYVTWLVGLAAVCLPIAHSRVGRSLLAFTLAFSASAFMTYVYKDVFPPFGAWIGLVCLTTLAPPLLAFLVSYRAWRPVKQAPQEVNKMETRWK